MSEKSFRERLADRVPDVGDRVPEGVRTRAGDLRARGETVGTRIDDLLVDPIRRNDVLLIGAVMLGIYALFLLVASQLGYDVNGTVNLLRRVTFLVAAYAMLALALNLHWGYTGLFNIGVTGFMAVGVYTLAILTGSPTGVPPGLGLPLWVGVVGGVVAAALVGALAALPALRLDADYFAIVTVGLAEIIRLSLNSTTFQEFTVAGVTAGTGGANGIALPSNPIWAVYYVGGEARNGTTAIGETIFSLTGSYGIVPSVVIKTTYALLLALVFVPLFYVLLVRTGNSPFGRVLKAIREDEIVAKSLGKDTARFKIIAFMVGTALMGLGAILWYGPRGFVNPTVFRPLITFYVFVALIIGGSGSNTGSVVGGAVFAALLFLAPPLVGDVVGNALPQGTTTPNTFVDAVASLVSLDGYSFIAYTVQNVAALRYVLVGAVLVYIIQNRPAGLLGHRKEPAASVDLMERPDRRRGTGGTGTGGTETPATDGGSDDE